MSTSVALNLYRPYAAQSGTRGARRVECQNGFSRLTETPSPQSNTKRETMGDFLCRQDERRRSYQAPSADSSDDDVDDTTLSGRAHLLCCERCNRSFNPPLSKEPSSRAAKSVEDDTP